MTRQQLHELIDVVPEDAISHLGEILEDLLEENTASDPIWENPEFVAHATERVRMGEEALARGEFVSMEDAKKRFAKWLKP